MKMTKNTINCAECKVEYTYEVPTNYPDKRKYCANCSEKKQKEWDKGPEETDTTTTTFDTNAAAKECHLSPEQQEHNKRWVKVRALESAIGLIGTPREDLNIFGKSIITLDLMAVADKFVEWIYNAN